MYCWSRRRIGNRFTLILACGLAWIVLPEVVTSARAETRQGQPPKKATPEHPYVAPRLGPTVWSEFVDPAIPGFAETKLPEESPKAKSQDKKPQKRPPLIPPKRIVAVNPIEVKLTAAPAPSGFSFGAGVNNSSAQATTVDGVIEIANPADFGQGLGDVMITSLTDSKGFLVVDIPSGAGAGAPAPDEPTPDLVLKAVITEMSCRKRSGGLSIGGVSGGQGQYENKVTMDVRLVDPLTNVVIDSVKATGRKTSKSSIFGASKYAAGSYWDPATKVLDLSFGDFEDSPLAEATRLATQDAVKKLIEKAQKRPWEAKVIKVIQEESGPEFYLNVDSDCGLKVGDQLELMRLGELIVDEKTGKVQGRARSKSLGRVQVFECEGSSVVCRPAGELLIPESPVGLDLIVRSISKP